MGTAADTTRDGAPPPTRRRPAVVLALTVATLALLAVAWHAIALGAYASTDSAAPVADRLVGARIAATLEPWKATFRWRLVTLEGLQLFRRGWIDSAFWLLEPYSQVVRGDPLYRSVYQEVVSAKTPLDARKAHVQHSREQTGGVLLEKDVVH
jgi:hypothetical protein